MEVVVCDVCKKVMTSGYVVYDDEYYCSEECLHEKYSDEQYQKIYESGNGYWTEWED